ncbi:hypothetical protein GCM10007908_14710 [Rhizobium albus]|nr:hypothetical protein GCM10007908_14710 [Rhizobium albus]
MPLVHLPQSRYSLHMNKLHRPTAEPTKRVIRDAAMGRFVELRGADSMKSVELPLREGIDLTRPIAEQAAKHKTPGRRKDVEK